MLKRLLQIAIDGPIGSGKSTVAQLVAKKLHLFLIDAGGFYRAAAYVALRDKLPVTQYLNVARRFKKAQVVERKPNKTEQDGRKITVLLDGEDISWKIRTHQIDDLVAKFAQHKEIVSAVHEKERELAQSQSVIAEGREIGSLVFPKAQVKVYLTADVRKRAARRIEEYRKKGDKTLESEIIRALKERDELDMRRVYAPLVRARGAVLLDTTDMTAEQAAEEIIKLVPEEQQ